MHANHDAVTEIARRLLRASATTLWLLIAVAGPAPAADETGNPAESTAAGSAEAVTQTDPFDAPERSEDFAAEIDFFKVESDVVTSVSRNPESLWTAAAAVYVVTGEEIRASAAQNVMEALRMVPGLDVASVDRNNWAIQARGLNNTFADKMLVLLDGRPIYTPLFGGTIWHQWKTFLPDIDRIEVIRGPGGTMWGSNAVNGVINIITKSSEDTRGALLRGEGGSNYQGQLEGRWGQRIDHFNYRLWMRGETDEGFGADGGDGINDDRRQLSGGYRFDWDLGKGLMLRSSGEATTSRLGSNTIDAATGGSADLGDKWQNFLLSTVWKLEKDFANGSNAHLLVGGDYIDQTAPFISVSIPAIPPFLPDPVFDKFQTIRRGLYAEFQHSLRPHRRHRLTWGGNYWLNNVDVNDSIALGLDPGGEDALQLGGGFIQDEIEVWKGGKLTAGIKIESNTFTGFNWQPSGRLSHAFNDDTTLWGAVSRAVNTPAYGDMFVEFTLPPDTGTIPGVTIQPRFLSEGATDTELVSLEMGLRRRFGEQLTMDLTGFYDWYDGIGTFSGRDTALTPTDCGTPGGPTTCRFDTFFDNLTDGHGGGIEGVFDMRWSERVRGEVNFSWQRLTTGGVVNKSTPEWKVNLRGYWDVSDQVSIVPTVHFVDDITVPSIFTGLGQDVDIEGYARLDIAAHYKPSEAGPTFSLVGQNINQRRHEEFSEPIIRPIAEVTRSWFIRVEQEF